METMVNNRLVYSLESSGIINEEQSGFRKGRSTLDPLLRLTSDIKKGLNLKRSTLAVFLDLEKAYDLIWHDGLLVSLKNHGITGNIFKFVSSFLKNRKIQVRIHDTLSDQYELENGVAQGSVISPTLFNIYINTLSQTLHNKTKLAQFADDGCIWSTGKNIRYLTKHIQTTLTAINEWANKWGFKPSKQKTIAMYFSKSKKLPELYLGQTKLKFEKQVRYLGMIIDHKLTWSKHIQYVKETCQKAINTMRYISGCKFGANKTTQLMLYKALVRSRLDYGCQVYNTASDTVLKHLDVIQHSALRVALRAIKNTNTNSLLAEAGEPPLTLRRENLTLKYWARTQSHGDKFLLNKEIKDSEHPVNNNRAPYPSEIIRLKQKYGLDSVKISRKQDFQVPWLKTDPNVSLDLLKMIDKQNDPIGAKNLALELIDRKYNNFTKFYTDGSKNPDSNRVGLGIYNNTYKVKKSLRLSDRASVYTAELMAIQIALIGVKKNHTKFDKVVILSDSLSSLQSLITGNSSRPKLLNAIHYMISEIDQLGIDLQFEWIPSHVDIPGNEVADQLAKEALGSNVIHLNIDLSVTEVVSIINNKTQSIWQDSWSKLTNNWLRNIEDNVKIKTQLYSYNKTEDTVITRLRLGYSKLGHNINRIKKEVSPYCINCGEPETIEHILFECSAHDNHRSDFKDEIENLDKIKFDTKSILNPPKQHMRHIFDLLTAYLTAIDYLDKI
ncbi:hypothetical protein CI610_03074 [invertebrate metagenome]|uniref:Reverse transcriptase domain-containing protein n=1 Tax=invertebrate metagenome TaxID=1711999 RepID=A0A2H9T438_9ZZZZ